MNTFGGGGHNNVRVHEDRVSAVITSNITNERMHTCLDLIRRRGSPSRWWAAILSLL